MNIEIGRIQDEAKSAGVVKAGLLGILAQGRNWRMRHCVHTLLYFGDAWTAKAIAAKQDLHVDTANSGVTRVRQFTPVFTSGFQ